MLSLTTLLEEIFRFMSKLSNVSISWNNEHVSRACFRFVTCVHPGEYNDVVTSPYNIAHSLRLLTEHASFVIPVDNKVMYRILTEGVTYRHFRECSDVLKNCVKLNCLWYGSFWKCGFLKLCTNISLVAQYIQTTFPSFYPKAYCIYKGTYNKTCICRQK